MQALFWLVFTIMGLHVFGAVEIEDSAYPNFTTFMNSLVSTFNILNLENWDQQMYPLIRATNWGTAAYYVLWIIIGECGTSVVVVAVWGVGGRVCCCSPWAHTSAFKCQCFWLRGRAAAWMTTPACCAH